MSGGRLLALSVDDVGVYNHGQAANSALIDRGEVSIVIRDSIDNEPLWGHGREDKARMSCESEREMIAFNPDRNLRRWVAGNVFADIQIKLKPS